MEQKYDFNQIPKGWKFCFNADCPMHIRKTLSSAAKRRTTISRRFASGVTDCL